MKLRMGLFLSLLSASALAAESAPPADARIAVEMPALQRALMREDMIDHLAALNEILVELGAGRLAAAADIAEQRMGVSSMGKHAKVAGGRGPGRFMPADMRAMGQGMHQAASEFARVARTGDREAALQALQPVLGGCVACHASYRLR